MAHASTAYTHANDADRSVRPAAACRTWTRRTSTSVSNPFRSFEGHENPCAGRGKVALTARSGPDSTPSLLRSQGRFVRAMPPVFQMRKPTAHRKRVTQMPNIGMIRKTYNTTAIHQFSLAAHYVEVVRGTRRRRRIDHTNNASVTTSSLLFMPDGRKKGVLSKCCATQIARFIWQPTKGRKQRLQFKAKKH